MRNLFIVLTIVLSFALAGQTLACGNHGEPKCGPRDAELNLTFQADRGAYMSSFSSTGYHGNYNDNASATADAFAGGNLNVDANAAGTSKQLTLVGWFFIFPIFDIEYVDNPAIADGFGTADGLGKAWTFTDDFGRTSTSKAGAYTFGSAFTAGSAIGKNGCRESVDSLVYVGGTVDQGNEAGETGYSNGQGVSGGNQSGGSFYAEDHDYVSGRGFAADTNYIEGGMLTKGNTVVSIDPYGNHRSIDAFTQNMVEVNAPAGDSFVYGSGGVGGMSSKGNSFAGGNANFGYNGVTYGNGNSSLNANVNLNGNGSATVSVTAHSYSVSDGGVCEGSCSGK